MKTLLKYLLCFSLFATPVAAQSLNCISPLGMCRVGKYTYFQITASRTKSLFKPQGWQLLVSKSHVQIPWWIPGLATRPGGPPTPIYLYLLPDAMFVRSVHCIHANPKIFWQFRGALDAKGQAAFEVRVPNIQCLVGQRFWMQAVLTWVPWSNQGCPIEATNPLCVWIHP